MTFRSPPLIPLALAVSGRYDPHELVQVIVDTSGSIPAGRVADGEAVWRGICFQTHAAARHAACRYRYRTSQPAPRRGGRVLKPDALPSAASDVHLGRVRCRKLAPAAEPMSMTTSAASLHCARLVRNEQWAGLSWAATSAPIHMLLRRSATSSDSFAGRCARIRRCTTLLFTRQRRLAASPKLEA